MAKPSMMSTAYIAGSASGSASTKNPSALPSMLASVSGSRPIAKMRRA